jgi:hypothetical protein
LKKPDNVDVSIELRDWLFALEGAQDIAKRWWFSSQEDIGREQRCWHTTFHSLLVNAKSSPKKVPGGKAQSHRIQFPLELVSVKPILFSLRFNAVCVCKFLSGSFRSWLLL